MSEPHEDARLSDSELRKKRTCTCGAWASGEEHADGCSWTQQHDLARKVAEIIYGVGNVPMNTHLPDVAAIMQLIAQAQEEARTAERQAIKHRVETYIRETLAPSDTGLGGYLSMNPMNVGSLIGAMNWAVDPAGELAQLHPKESERGEGV